MVSALMAVDMVEERVEFMVLFRVAGQVEERMESRVLFRVVGQVEERVESRVLFRVVDQVEEMVGMFGKTVSLKLSAGRTSPSKTSDSSG